MSYRPKTGVALRFKFFPAISAVDLLAKENTWRSLIDFSIEEKDRRYGEMVKVYDKIRVRHGDRCVELTALFDTGAGGSHLSDEVAEKIGYKPQLSHRAVRTLIR